jgi:hypothetical protein
MRADELRRLLADAATGAEPVPLGNWRAEETEDGYWAIDATGDGKVTPIHAHITLGPAEGSHRLIAAAVNALPALLDCAEALRFHNQTPTGSTRKCLSDCVACDALARLDGAS